MRHDHLSRLLCLLLLAPAAGRAERLQITTPAPYDILQWTDAITVTGRAFDLDTTRSYTLTIDGVTTPFTPAAVGTSTFTKALHVVHPRFMGTVGSAPPTHPYPTWLDDDYRLFRAVLVELSDAATGAVVARARTPIYDLRHYGGADPTPFDVWPGARPGGASVLLGPEFLGALVKPLVALMPPAGFLPLDDAMALALEDAAGGPDGLLLPELTGPEICLPADTWPADVRAALDADVSAMLSAYAVFKTAMDSLELGLPGYLRATIALAVPFPIWDLPPATDADVQFCVTRFTTTIETISGGEVRDATIEPAYDTLVVATAHGDLTASTEIVLSGRLQFRDGSFDVELKPYVAGLLGVSSAGPVPNRSVDPAVTTCHDVPFVGTVVPELHVLTVEPAADARDLDVRGAMPGVTVTATSWPDDESLCADEALATHHEYAQMGLEAAAANVFTAAFAVAEPKHRLPMAVEEVLSPAEIGHESRIAVDLQWTVEAARERPPATSPEIEQGLALPYTTAVDLIAPVRAPWRTVWAPTPGSAAVPDALLAWGTLDAADLRYDLATGTINDVLAVGSGTALLNFVPTPTYGDLDACVPATPGDRCVGRWSDLTCACDSGPPRPAVDVAVFDEETLAVFSPSFAGSGATSAATLRFRATSPLTATMDTNLGGEGYSGTYLHLAQLVLEIVEPDGAGGEILWARILIDLFDAAFALRMDPTDGRMSPTVALGEWDATLVEHGLPAWPAETGLRAALEPLLTTWLVPAVAAIAAEVPAPEWDTLPRIGGPWASTEDLPDAYHWEDHWISFAALL